MMQMVNIGQNIERSNGEFPGLRHIRFFGIGPYAAKTSTFLQLEDGVFMGVKVFQIGFNGNGSLNGRKVKFGPGRKKEMGSVATNLLGDV